MSARNTHNPVFPVYIIFLEFIIFANNVTKLRDDAAKFDWWPCCWKCKLVTKSIAGQWRSHLNLLSEGKCYTIPKFGFDGPYTQSIICLPTHKLKYISFILLTNLCKAH